MKASYFLRLKCLQPYQVEHTSSRLILALSNFGLTHGTLHFSVTIDCVRILIRRFPLYTYSMDYILISNRFKNDILNANHILKSVKQYSSFVFRYLYTISEKKKIYFEKNVKNIYVKHWKKTDVSAFINNPDLQHSKSSHTQWQKLLIIGTTLSVANSQKIHKGTLH